MENETRKKPGKVGNFFFCLWVIIAMVLIQFGVSLTGAIAVFVKKVLECHGDMAEASRRYTEYVQTSGIMTYLEFAAVTVCLIIAGIWYYFGYVRKDKRAGRYESVWPKFKDPKAIFFLIVGSISCFALATLLDTFVEWLLPEQAEKLQEVMKMTLNGNILIGLLSVVILAPICEELALRGIILQHSKRVHGIVGCMILNAVLFGVFHMNPIQGLYVLPMGLFWAFVGYKFNSVVPSIFCHAMNNFLGMFVGNFIGGLAGIWLSFGIFVVFGWLAAFIGSRMEVFRKRTDPDSCVKEIGN